MYTRPSGFNFVTTFCRIPSISFLGIWSKTACINIPSKLSSILSILFTSIIKNFAAGTSSFAISINLSEKSIPVTSKPLSARYLLFVPPPQPTSRTFPPSFKRAINSFVPSCHQVSALWSSCQFWAILLYVSFSSVLSIVFCRGGRSRTLIARFGGECISRYTTPLCVLIIHIFYLSASSV